MNPAWLLKLRALPWRWIAAGALVLLAVWQVRAYADRVADGREAEVRALWADDTARRDKAAADAINAAEADRLAAVAIGSEEVDEYEAVAAAAIAERDDVFGLLQQARREVRSCSSNRATDTLVAAERGETDRARAVDEAIAGVVTEHRLNAAQLNALVRLLKSQQVCPVVMVE